LPLPNLVQLKINNETGKDLAEAKGQ